MRKLHEMTPEQFVGFYGNDPKSGVLFDHLEGFDAAGGIVRGAASGTGRVWAVVDGRAYPVVCSEIIEVWTEDGRSDGRCGRPIEVGPYCEAHAEIVAAWCIQSDAEVAAWERAMGTAL